jgi:hypothetical protein
MVILGICLPWRFGMAERGEKGGQKGYGFGMGERGMGAGVGASVQTREYGFWEGGAEGALTPCELDLSSLFRCSHFIYTYILFRLFALVPPFSIFLHSLSPALSLFCKYVLATCRIRISVTAIYCFLYLSKFSYLQRSHEFRQILAVATLQYIDQGHRTLSRKGIRGLGDL